MEELRIPKRRISAEFRLHSCAESERLDVFLSDNAPAHRGPERLSDLLNGDTEFLPVLEEQTNRMRFVHRTAILVARVSPEEEPDDAASEQTIPTEHAVRLLLSDGSSVEGLLSYVLPPERSRINDFLNSAPTFFRVLEKTGVALVNKRHLVQVTLAD